MILENQLGIVTGNKIQTANLSKGKQDKAMEVHLGLSFKHKTCYFLGFQTQTNKHTISIKNTNKDHSWIVDFQLGTRLPCSVSWIQPFTSMLPFHRGCRIQLKKVSFNLPMTHQVCIWMLKNIPFLTLFSKVSGFSHALILESTQINKKPTL